MPHRGRLNLLVNILDYEFRYLCRKISGKTDTPHDLRNIIDDVTSHIAHSTVKQYG
jgi:probable 2-oxoglutarate dehydrogenase E1 component DHKTD1